MSDGSDTKHGTCALCGVVAQLRSCVTCGEWVCENCLTTPDICELCESEDLFPDD